MTRVVLPPLLLTGEAPPRVHELAAARYAPLLPFVIDGDSVLQQTLPAISSQEVEAHLSRPLLGPVAAGAAAPLSADRTLPPAQAILAPALRPDQPLNQRPLLPPVHVYSPSNGYRPRTSHADQPFGPQTNHLDLRQFHFCHIDNTAMNSQGMLLHPCQLLMYQSLHQNLSYHQIDTRRLMLPSGDPYTYRYINSITKHAHIVLCHRYR
ncbi:uncharacterized protein [Miscanthus floridulus]|uniref:uncharacterized protein isoform X2 n=1 Tax=Miscanthus floridulus TaxID=154761 RepID=UPI00345B2670